MAAVFIPQKALDAWIDQGKISLDDSTLTLLKEERTVELGPAVRFRSLLGADEDPHALLGKVKTHEQLTELGAEHYMDSVILGEVAYQVEEGFMGDLSCKKETLTKVVPAVVALKRAAPSPVAIEPSNISLSSASLLLAVAEKSPVAPLEAPLSIPPFSADAAPTLIPQAVATPLEKALSKSAEGDCAQEDAHENTDETDAEALSRLFLDTVQ